MTPTEMMDEAIKKLGSHFCTKKFLCQDCLVLEEALRWAEAWLEQHTREYEKTTYIDLAKAISKGKEALR